jgi:hypothetical protein
VLLVRNSSSVLLCLPSGVSQYLKIVNIPYRSPKECRNLGDFFVWRKLPHFQIKPKEVHIVERGGGSTSEWQTGDQPIDDRRVDVSAEM